MTRRLLSSITALSGVIVGVVGAACDRITMYHKYIWDGSYLVYMHITAGGSVLGIGKVSSPDPSYRQDWRAV